MAEENLNYNAKPLETCGPEPHYNSGGTNESDNSAKVYGADMRMAYNQALAYIITGDTKYADVAHRIIDAWANTLKRVTSEQGKANINFYSPYAIIAAGWTVDVNNWNHKPFDSMLKNIILPATKIDNNLNHGLWAAFMQACAAQYLKDPILMKNTFYRWGKIMKKEVDPNDGSMPQEMDRSATSNYHGGPDRGIKGMAYTHYALLPATMAAKIFDSFGLSPWNSEGGRLLELAFGKAAEWTNHPERFPFYASNNGNLIDVRTCAYFIILQKHYNNEDAKEVMKAGNIDKDHFYLLDLFK